MKLFDRQMELSVLRTFCSGNQKLVSVIVQGLSDDSFHTKVGKEIYERVSHIASTRGTLLKWADLKGDIALTDETRETIKKSKLKPITNIKDLKERINLLDNYRRARVMYQIAETINNDLIKKDSVDVDKLHDKISNLISTSSSVGSTDGWFLHIGGEDSSAFKETLKEVLNPTKINYIPTGIKVFDNKNRGVPRGYLWNIVGPTGWGKSVMANMIGGNMARQGARVGILSLEMSHFENLQRQVARVSDTEMDELLDPKNRLSTPKLQEIAKVMNTWYKTIKRAGGLLSIITPDKDVSIKDVMFALEPFNYDIIIIDYVGLLKGADGDDQVKALSRIGRFAKLYAGNHNMIVALCAQFNSEKGKIKYSGALEEHASLQWQWRVTEETKETNVIMVEQPKARGLNPMDFFLKANFAKMRFESVDRETIDESKFKNSEESGKSESSSKNKKTNRKKTSGNGVYDLE